MIYNITTFGAIADGKAVNTAAIQRAIDTANTTGGGTVLVPPGTFVTGSIQLKTNVTLELSPGSVLLGSPDIADYPPVGSGHGDRTRMHLVYAVGARNVSIRGTGTIDGNGPAFWEPTMRPADPNYDDGTPLTLVAAKQRDPEKQRITWILADNSKRPSPMIDFRECADVNVHDVTITNSGGWNVHMHLCDRVFIRGVKLLCNLLGPNNDGFDIMGCHDVMISDCYLSCCDDAIVLKTWKDERGCARITVTNCVIRTYCAALKLGHGESYNYFRQITFSNCTVFESHRAVAIYSSRGGVIEDVAVTNIVCGIL